MRRLGELLTMAEEEAQNGTGAAATLTKDLLIMAAALTMKYGGHPRGLPPGRPGPVPRRRRARHGMGRGSGVRYAFLLSCARCGRFTLETVDVPAGGDFYLRTRCNNLDQFAVFGRPREACNWVNDAPLQMVRVDLISQPAEGGEA